MTFAKTVVDLKVNLAAYYQPWLTMISSVVLALFSTLALASSSQPNQSPKWDNKLADAGTRQDRVQISPHAFEHFRNLRRAAIHRMEQQAVPLEHIDDRLSVHETSVKINALANKKDTEKFNLLDANERIRLANVRTKEKKAIVRALKKTICAAHNKTVGILGCGTKVTMNSVIHEYCSALMEMIKLACSRFDDNGQLLQQYETSENHHVDPQYIQKVKRRLQCTREDDEVTGQMVANVLSGENYNRIQAEQTWTCISQMYPRLLHGAFECERQVSEDSICEPQASLANNFRDNQEDAMDVTFEIHERTASTLSSSRLDDCSQ